MTWQIELVGIATIHNRNYHLATARLGLAGGALPGAGNAPARLPALIGRSPVMAEAGDQPKGRKKKKEKRKKEKYNKNIEKKKTTKLYKFTKRISVPGIEVFCRYLARFYVQKLFLGTEIEKTLSVHKLFSGIKTSLNAPLIIQLKRYRIAMKTYSNHLWYN